MSIKAFIRLRLLQAYRIIKEVGWLILVLLLFVSIAFISQLVYGILQSSFLQSFTFSLILLSLIHFSRKDLLFLQIHTQHADQFRQLLLAEYGLAVSPLLLIALLGSNWQGAVGIAFSMLSAFIFPIKTTRFLSRYWNPKLSWIPNKLFEIKSLIRKRLPYIILIYVLGLLSSLHIAFFIICIVLSALFISSAFEWVEPPELIRWDNHFLSRKIGLHSFYVQAVFLPVYGLALIFHPAEYYFTLFGVFLIQMILFFSICYKYAMYRPQARRFSQSIVHAVYFLFLLIPGFQLVCIFLCIWYGIKAKKTMTYFWNDQISTHAPAT